MSRVLTRRPQVKYSLSPRSKSYSVVGHKPLKSICDSDKRIANYKVEYSYQAENHETFRYPLNGEPADASHIGDADYRDYGRVFDQQYILAHERGQDGAHCLWEDDIPQLLKPVQTECFGGLLLACRDRVDATRHDFADVRAGVDRKTYHCCGKRPQLNAEFGKYKEHNEYLDEKRRPPHQINID